MCSSKLRADLHWNPELASGIIVQVKGNRLIARLHKCVRVRARDNHLPEKSHQPCVRTPVLQFVVKVHPGIGIFLCLFGHGNRDIQAAAEAFNVVTGK